MPSAEIAHQTASVWVFHDVPQCFMSVSWCFTSVSWYFTSVSRCFKSVSWCSVSHATIGIGERTISNHCIGDRATTNRRTSNRAASNRRIGERTATNCCIGNCHTGEFSVWIGDNAAKVIPCWTPSCKETGVTPFLEDNFEMGPPSVLYCPRPPSHHPSSLALVNLRLYFIFNL